MSGNTTVYPPESVPKIAAEVRRACGGEDGRGPAGAEGKAIPAEAVLEWANRFEAAWENDRWEWTQRAEELLGHFRAYRGAVESAQKTPVRAMLLEVARWLEGILAWQNRRSHGGFVRIGSDYGFYMLDKIRAAMAIPVRNCEKHADEDDAFAAWHDSLKDGDIVRVRDAFKWMFAKSDAEGAK